MAFRYSIRHTIKHRRLIHKRLQRRLLLFPIIALVMFIVVIVDAIRTGVSPFWIIAGGLVGLGIGYLVSLVYKIYWREDQGKIVTGIDRLTVLLILAYIAFRIGSDQLLDHLIHGDTLVVATYSLLGGILLGRMVGVLRKVNRVLEQQTVLERVRNMPRKRGAKKRAR